MIYNWQLDNCSTHLPFWYICFWWFPSKWPNRWLGIWNSPERQYSFTTPCFFNVPPVHPLRCLCNREFPSFSTWCNDLYFAFFVSFRIRIISSCSSSLFRMRLDVCRISASSVLCCFFWWLRTLKT